MNNKVPVTLLLICALILSLVGCSKSGNSQQDSSVQSTQEAEASSSPVKLTVWGAEADTELMEQVIAGFKSEYSGTQFEIAYIHFLELQV